jgi:hypothetical protein
MRSDKETRPAEGLRRADIFAPKQHYLALLFCKLQKKMLRVLPAEGLEPTRSCDLFDESPAQSRTAFFAARLVVVVDFRLRTDGTDGA